MTVRDGYSCAVVFLQGFGVRALDVNLLLYSNDRSENISTLARFEDLEVARTAAFLNLEIVEAGRRV